MQWVTCPEICFGHFFGKTFGTAGVFVQGVPPMCVIIEDRQDHSGVGEARIALVTHF